MAIISIINNKGGVGKTTSVNILATILSTLEKKILLVDLDESGNLSLSFGHFHDDPQGVIDGIEFPDAPNISELFKFRYRKAEDVHKVIYPTFNPWIDIIPASKRHKNTPSTLLQSTGNNNIVLQRALTSIKDEYDFIFIDNAPGENILTVNSMFASDYLLIPVRPESFSYKGLRETLASQDYIVEEHNLTNLKLLGTFITQANPRTKNFKESSGEWHRDFAASGLEEKFFKSFIRTDSKIDMSNKKLKSILEYPNSIALIDYSRLLLETGLLDENSARRLEEAIS